jgi:hypothetical protein
VKKLACILAAIVVAAAPLGAFLTELDLVGSPSVSGVRNDFTGWVGIRFTFNTGGAKVTRLCRWVVSGNSAAHTVKLRDETTSTDVVSGSVNTTGATAGQFACASVTQTAITSGDTFNLWSQESSGGDQWYNDGSTTFTISSDATSLNSSYSTDGSSTNTNAGSGHAFGPPNMKYCTTDCAVSSACPHTLATTGAGCS